MKTDLAIAQKAKLKPIKEIAKKAKAKRIYGFIKPKLRDYYLLLGFEEIKKIPDELSDRPRRIKEYQGYTPTPIALEKIKLKEDQSFSQIPDLVIIDGGKGQLSSGTKVFKTLGLEIPYISLAKKLEEIFTPTSPEPIVLERQNSALKLLQRARDEAHRFAISYNRHLRSKKYRTR